MNAEVIKLTYNISRDEFKDLVRNTLLIKEVIDNGGKIVKLGSLLESTKYGYTASALKEGNVKLIRITDLKNNFINIETVPFCNCVKYEDYLVKKGDILIGRTGTVGKSFLLDYDLEYKSIYASYLIRLRTDRTKVLSEYIYLFLNSYYFWNQLHAIKSGAVKMNINANKIKDLKIPYCSIDDQKKILEKIKELTPLLENTLDKIGNIYLVDDSTNKNLSYIKQLKQAILQEAIEGKLTKTWREQNPEIEPATVLLEKIAKEKEELIKQKKLKKQEKLKEILVDEIPFDVPESWEWSRFGNIIQDSGNLNIHTNLDENDLINYVDITSIDNKKYQIGEIIPQKVSELSSRARRILKKGFIIYSLVRPYLNNLAIIEDEKHNYIGSTGFNVFKPIIIDTNYIFNFLLSEYIKNYYLELIKGFNSPSITNNDFINTIFPLPPLLEQKEIVKKVDELMNLCDLLEKQCLEAKESSENLMKSVLSDAFSK